MDKTEVRKRVICLYRVSTKQQVNKSNSIGEAKDDIPMQRIVCRDFCANKNWDIVSEMYEKGVSGYKKSANERDAIIELREMAIRREFDILLVFMFDRLGRREDETPFVLQWFVEHGIEVWSANEGQQKIETHADKLMNYIRFWQASGESEKTSLRVKTRMEQMTSEGVFTGGSVPYGYQLVYRGRKNKKGQDVRDLEIHPEQSEVVMMVFKYTIELGYGSHMLAEHLNKLGYRTQKGALFQSSYILRILRNPIYRGFLQRGDARSERIEALQIISDTDFFKAQDILDQRARKDESKRTIAMTNKGKTLLNGNIYCAHCGCRLATTSYTERYKRKDGSLYEKQSSRYVCYHRSRGLNDCDGATTYIADKIDKAIMKAMRTIFANISGCPQEEKIVEAYKSVIAGNHKLQQKLNYELQRDTTQLESLRLEIGKALIGESVYTQEDLATAITALRKKISDNQEKLEELKQEDAAKKAISDNIIPAYRQFKTWSEEFDAAPLEMKKMIASQLFSRIEIGKGYEIHLELDTTFKTFCDEWVSIQQITAIA
jgi:DNA invertase Pin-like site-specific DNA recombinase